MPVQRRRLGLRNNALIAQFVEETVTHPEPHFALTVRIRSELHGQDRRSAESFNPFVLNIHGSVIGARASIGHGASPKASKKIRNHNRGKKDPYAALPASPAALKFNIGTNGQLIVDLRDRLPRRGCLRRTYFGYLTDRLGRRKLFLLTLAIYSTATLASALSWNFFSFAIFRFITGLGIGGEYAAINSAVDELISSKVRGTVDKAISWERMSGGGWPLRSRRCWPWVFCTYGWGCRKVRVG